MTSPEGGFNQYEKLMPYYRPEDAELLVEWSGIIEKRAVANCNDSAFARVKFMGSVNDQKKFVLDIDVQTPEMTLCLLRAIQSCLELMPAATKRFYAALMDSLAEDAEEKEGAASDA